MLKELHYDLRKGLLILLLTRRPKGAMGPTQPPTGMGTADAF
jgi:hypothetical protein